ncbi:MAG: hypothetical protein LBG65_06455 [Puniceicoccales bacterium]|jgi:hypothetical protein|nr:hypothetical protein [Puniceicoccales bacterium]
MRELEERNLREAREWYAARADDGKPRYRDQYDAKVGAGLTPQEAINGGVHSLEIHPRFEDAMLAGTMRGVVDSRIPPLTARCTLWVFVRLPPRGAQASFMGDCRFLGIVKIKRVRWCEFDAGARTFSWLDPLPERPRAHRRVPVTDPQELAALARLDGFGDAEAFFAHLLHRFHEGRFRKPHLEWDAPPRAPVRRVKREKGAARG